MIVTVILVALVLLGLGFIIGGQMSYDRDSKAFARGIGAIVLAIAGLVFLFSSTTIIQAKNVGVLTTFGKTSDRTLTPGLHWKKPWQKVTELDGTTISDEYRGDNCIYVRIGDGSTACVSATNRWRIVTDKANLIYGEYRSDDVRDTVRDALVSTVFKASVNQVLGEYDPTADLRVTDALAGASADFAPDYDALTAKVEANMKQRIAAQGGMVEIRSITISYLKLSDSTQKKINDWQAEVGNTRIALQRKQTAIAQAEANRALSESVSNDPNVLVAKCFDTLAAMVEAEQQVPAGFTCWPGSNSALVVPSGR